MNTLERQARLLAELPDATRKENVRPADHVECACRKKVMHVSEIKHHFTGVCNATDTMCDECLRQVTKHALVVCVGCRAVVARMAPTTLKSGFKIESRKIYHTDCCPTCRPEVERSTIVEAELFYRSVKR